MSDPDPAPDLSPVAPARSQPMAGGITPGSVKVRSPLAVVLWSIVTLGIYHLYWIYQVYRELKETNREGIGPLLGLVFALLLGIVNWFVLPAEIGTMYERNGQAKPVSGLTGFWNLLPLIGTIVWVVKVQGALNREWERLGA
ncbi:MAG TPA: DUF4234 domain-containing protein [Microthrixaceae bacterium]|nr:DUF4234 domain-containing protein [Microthrixaceae bacterium]